MKEIKDNFKDLIEQSGNNFHLEIVNLLRKNGWETEVSPYYYDDVDDKPREIDILAKKPIFVLKGQEKPTYNVYLFIECKNLKEEVVFWPDDLNKDKSVVFLNKIDPYYFYEIEGSNSYVEIMDNIPFRFETKNWVWDMRDWYLNIENINSPVIYDTGKDDIKKYEQISKKELANVPKNPVENKGRIIYEKVEREKIEFYTTGIGQPHVIKVSYFPNWKVYGAEGPFLVSPSFMLVIPTQSNVTLVYGKTIENIVGNTLTVTGWVIVAVVLISNLVILLIKRRKKKLKKTDQ